MGFCKYLLEGARRFVGFHILLLALMSWRVTDGSSLLYTTLQQTTFNILRQFATCSHLFTSQKHSTGYRIIILVWWDSLGKILVLRDSFWPKTLGRCMGT